MKINLEKLPKSRVKLAIEVPKADVQPYFEQAYQKLSQEVKIVGFRPGKAPKLMIIESVGLNRYNSTALDLILPQIYSQAIQQEKLVPISAPAVSIEKFSEDEDFVFKAEVDLKPEIKLGDYKKLKIKNKKLKIRYEARKEEVEKIIKRLLYQTAKFTEVEQPAKKGDFIEIDFEGSVKGVKKENLCSKNYPLILGEKVLIPGFEEKLEGMKKGESKSFEIEIDRKYTHSTSSGQADPTNITNRRSHKEKVKFTAKMNMVKKVELPELNEEFAKKFGRKDEEDLKKAITESIAQEKEQQAKAVLQQEILEKIAEKTILEIPQSLVEQEISIKIEEMQKQFGPIQSQYLEKTGKTINDLRKEMQAGAEKQVKFGLILGEVARDLGLIKGQIKTAEEQQEIVKKTMDKLVEITTK